MTHILAGQEESEGENQIDTHQQQRKKVVGTYASANHP